MKSEIKFENGPGLAILWQAGGESGTITRKDGYTTVTGEGGKTFAHLCGMGYAKAAKWLEAGNRPQARQEAA